MNNNTNELSLAKQTDVHIFTTYNVKNFINFIKKIINRNNTVRLIYASLIIVTWPEVSLNKMGSKERGIDKKGCLT